MESLTVLYDSGCSLCEWATRWLAGRPQLVPLYFIPAGSKEAALAFPWLDHSITLTDVTVIGDDGAVYQRERAWVMCLWSLRDYRKLANKIASPALLPSVKHVVAVVSRYRPHVDEECKDDRCGY